MKGSPREVLKPIIARRFLLRKLSKRTFHGVEQQVGKIVVMV